MALQQRSPPPTPLCPVWESSGQILRPQPVGSLAAKEGKRAPPPYTNPALDGLQGSQLQGEGQLGRAGFPAHKPPSHHQPDQATMTAAAGGDSMVSSPHRVTNLPLSPLSPCLCSSPPPPCPPAHPVQSSCAQGLCRRYWNPPPHMSQSTSLVPGARTRCRQVTVSTSCPGSPTARTH